MSPAKQRKRDELKHEVGPVIVRCRGEQHSIDVNARGRLCFNNHTLEELRADITASALAGVEPCGCAKLLGRGPSTHGPMRRNQQRLEGYLQPILFDTAPAPDARALATLVAERWWFFAGAAAATCQGPTGRLGVILIPAPGAGPAPSVQVSVRSIMSARLKLGVAEVPLAGSETDAVLLRLEALPRPGRPGEALALLPGRGGSRYAARAKLVYAQEGQLEARRIPGQAPPPRTTKASRAADADKAVEDLQVAIDAIVRRPPAAKLETNEATGTLHVGEGFTGRERKRRLDWESLAAAARRRGPGRYVTADGGAVAKSYNYRAQTEVGVGVCLASGVAVVFRGTADAHGGVTDAKIIRRAVHEAFSYAELTRKDERLAEVARAGLIRLAEAYAERAGLETGLV